LNVLSLFDGMSCGQLALERAGIKVDNYYASEIDKYAIAITKKNYPSTIHLGSIVDVKGADLPKIDLLIGGSPCQGFSSAGKQLNFDDERSKLFFEYIRLLKECKPKYFLLENVVMKAEHNDVISSILGEMYPECVEQKELFRVGRLEPHIINSNLVSAQNRKRLYWTNIPGMCQPEDKKILLYDILETKSNEPHDDFGVDEIKFHKVKPNIQANVKKYHEQIMKSKKTTYIMPVESDYSDNQVGLTKCITLRANNSCAYVLDRPNKTYRKITPVECERLQTVPDNYTNSVSDSQRYKMLGNGWTVDVIAHILKNMEKQ